MLLLPKLRLKQKIQQNHTTMEGLLTRATKWKNSATNNSWKAGYTGNRNHP